MKKIIAITTTALLLICFSTVSAYAGSARRHTMEGIMIGTGVAILGAAIINGIHQDSRPHYTRNYSRHDEYRHNGYRHNYKNKHHRKYRSHSTKGYWKIEKIWIGPVYEKRWNPGHYNRRGDWISSRHEKFLVQDGYFQKNKVWVRH